MSNLFKTLPFAILFHKCKELKEGQVLYSSFSSNGYFLIVKREQGYAIDAFKNKLPHERKGKRTGSSWFGSRKELEVSIDINPEWYAMDNVTKKLTGLNKWQEFLESFEHGHIVKFDPITKDGHPKFEFVPLINKNV